MDRAEMIKALEEWKTEIAWLGGSHTWQYRAKVLAEVIADLKMSNCKYCNPPFRTLLTLTIDPETGEEPTNIFFDCDGQSLRVYDDNPGNPQIDKVPIKFCPMCGRKLGGAE